jgi:hypothetical protein
MHWEKGRRKEEEKGRPDEKGKREGVNPLTNDLIGL